MSRWFVSLLAIGVLAIGAGCNTTPTQDGALLGGALGAGLGAIVGNQSGHGGEGALIGAGAGALIGAIAGDQVEQQQRREHAYHHQQHRPAPPPAQSSGDRVVRGHYETRIVESPTGEVYEERVWVPHGG
jgi:uncharacterized protein YcfJ